MANVDLALYDGSAGYLVDSNVWIDCIDPRSPWHDWSVDHLQACSERAPLHVNLIVYTELLVPEPDVAKLVHRLANQRDIKIEYRKVPGATHFFEGKLDVLSNLVERHLRHALSEAPSAAA